LESGGFLLVLAQLALEFFNYFKTINTIQGILFALGLLFLVLEVFTPGFGVAGGSVWSCWSSGSL